MSQNTRARKITARAPSNDDYLADPFLPQTPIGSLTPTRSGSPAPTHASDGPALSIFTRWINDPVAALKLLLFPVVLWANWELVAPFSKPGIPNPFGQFFLLSHFILESPPDDPRYAKGWSDLLFIGYYIVLCSCVRSVVVVKIGHPIARWFGLRRSAKLDRFGEQLWALVYFGAFGCWGYRIMDQSPTWWYQTKYFWIDYPHWDMKPELKAYYLAQTAHWCQELIGLTAGLEKPRKDFRILVAHHLVTLWLVGGSYFVNLTLIGNAVFVSMDLPDAFFAVSKLLNYIQWDNAKIYTFITFVGVWTYFRHYLNIDILISIWTEFHFIPPAARKWSPKDGTYLAGWMQFQIFLPLFVLQLLNLFWYYLIVRIFYRAVVYHTADDDRSDDEDDDDPKKED